MSATDRMDLDAVAMEQAWAEQEAERAERAWTFKPAAEAFALAIQQGRLSPSAYASNYAGDYMYMGTKSGRDLFKNANTRQYLGGS